MRKTIKSGGESLVGFRNQVSSLCLLQLFVAYLEARYGRTRRQRGGESCRSLQMHFQLLAKAYMSHPAPFPHSSLRVAVTALALSAVGRTLNNDCLFF